jgi:hypothetical protein
MTLGMDVIPTGRLPEYPSELRWTASHQVALGVLLVSQVVLYILMRRTAGREGIQAGGCQLEVDVSAQQVTHNARHIGEGLKIYNIEYRT